MKFLVALAAAAALAGCALPTRVMSSSERTVVVQARIQDAAAAQEAATTECRKYGRAARLSMKATDNQFVFDCVQ